MIHIKSDMVECYFNFFCCCQWCCKPFVGRAENKYKYNTYILLVLLLLLLLLEYVLFLFLLAHF